MYAHVVRTERLTPTMVRVVLGGGDLDRFAMVDATDAYVNLAFAPASAGYGGAFDPAEIRATRPSHEWPARRRFTVRRWDEERRELTIDFVVHGSDGTDGVAGVWASSAEPGDCLVFEGPAGGYRPGPDVDWHLMVGDESALPAIAASLEALPSGSTAVVRLLCDGPGHEVPLESAADLDLVWLHRRGSADGGRSDDGKADAGRDDDQLLHQAVKELSFPAGTVHAFVHGEAEEIRGVRRHLLQDRGLARSDMSCSPYWRRTMTDEKWREVKAEFVAAMESDVR